LLLILGHNTNNKKKNKKKRENKKIKKILEENKNISVRKAYQNAQEIDEDWLRKINVYFRLMNVLLAKKN
jgi:hypothetical protein